MKIYDDTMWKEKNKTKMYTCSYFYKQSVNSLFILFNEKSMQKKMHSLQF